MKTKIFLLPLMLLCIACGNHKEQQADQNSAAKVKDNTVQLNEAQFRNAGIVTAGVSEREISGTLKLNGKIDVPPQNMVSVSVPMGGYLRSTSLLPGMKINKGMNIAVIEDQQYIQLQQDYLTAKAKLNVLEKDYQRQKNLNASQAASDKVMQQAETDLRADRILMTTLGEKLQLVGIDPKSISETHVQRSVIIRSPIDGFVSKVNVNIGKYVSPTEVLFELVNPSDIHLALKVFEKDLDKLTIGQKVIAYTNNAPDKKYDCRVLLIGHDLSPERAADVHCHFETYDRSLVPGTYMNAEVEVKFNRSNTLPSEAIVQFEGKSYVFRETGVKTYEMIEVESGQSQDGYTQVDINVTGRSKFVVKGAYSLLMMLKNKAD